MSEWRKRLLKEGKLYGNAPTIDNQTDTIIDTTTPGIEHKEPVKNVDQRSTKIPQYSFNQLKRNPSLLENAPLIITKYNIPIYKIDIYQAGN